MSNQSKISAGKMVCLQNGWLKKPPTVIINHPARQGTLLYATEPVCYCYTLASVSAMMPLHPQSGASSVVAALLLQRQPQAPSLPVSVARRRRRLQAACTRARAHACLTATRLAEPATCACKRGRSVVGAATHCPAAAKSANENAGTRRPVTVLALRGFI